MNAGPPLLILFEDDDLLVINKPAGINTHSPSPFAGEGIYEWLKSREPRWSSLAIMHRLDKETSGVMVFSKSPEANRSLTSQFASREIAKKYLLLTAATASKRSFNAKSTLVRVGPKYVSRPEAATGEGAETQFKVLETTGQGTLVEAVPVTGKTHQIRVHAADLGLPILGDTLYGGAPAARVFLHAAELAFNHPATGKRLVFAAPADFNADPRLELRNRLIDLGETNAFRLIHGAADGFPGWYVDRLGSVLLSQSEAPLSQAQTARLREFVECNSLEGAFHKVLSKSIRAGDKAEFSPQPVLGTPAARTVVRENGLEYLLRFDEGYSVGLFLDQRDNRRRLAKQHVSAGFPLFGNVTGSAPEVLNTFAYTCAFSVCAAKAGAHVTSLDLSKKYLDWGKENFALNHIDSDDHEFIFGDVFDWLRRFAKKNRFFDVVLLDPPTFSRSKEHGPFRAEHDYGRLVTAALGVLKPGGVVFASTNAAELLPELFIATVATAITAAKRKILKQHFVPQPPDFPISREEPAHLKTIWLQIG